jgi:hypothetical protein
MRIRVPSPRLQASSTASSGGSARTPVHAPHPPMTRFAWPGGARGTDRGARSTARSEAASGTRLPRTRLRAERKRRSAGVRAPADLVVWIHRPSNPGDGEDRLIPVPWTERPEHAESAVASDKESPRPAVEPSAEMSIEIFSERHLSASLSSMRIRVPSPRLQASSTASSGGSARTPAHAPHPPDDAVCMAWGARGTDRGRDRPHDPMRHSG